MINFSFYILLTYLLIYLYTWPLYMIFTYLILLTEIIYLNIFSKFLSSVYVTSKLSILTVQLRWASQKISIILYATFFYNLKISIPNKLASLFGEMPLVWGKHCLTCKNQVSKVPTGLSSIKSNDEDHKDPLGSNKPGSSKALIRLS